MALISEWATIFAVALWFLQLSSDNNTFFFPVCATSDGGDIKTRSRDGDECQAPLDRVFRSSGATQTSVSGQRIVGHQRPEQVNPSHYIHCLFLLRMKIHTSVIVHVWTLWRNYINTHACQVTIHEIFICFISFPECVAEKKNVF